MTLYKWSQTASADATADATINWAEGQAPSTINDSARAMMAATAKYRDDIAGAIVTGGTSTAYTISSYEVFDTLAHLGGQMIAFTPNVTNGAGPVTLNVDGLGAKPLRSAPNVDLLAGVLIQGTPYVATYNNSDGAFYLHGFFGNPYNIPVAGGLDFWGSTAPNSSFAFPYGQAISRTTYAALFSLIGTTYGPGLNDGLTFSLPDKRGRVSACMDNMGAGDAQRLIHTAFVGGRFTLGGTCGNDTHILTVNEIPSHTHPNSLNDQGHSHNISHPSNNLTGASGVIVDICFANGGNVANFGNTQAAGTGISINNAAAGGGAAHEIVQPTILCNYIMRVI
jgi:microcystin-dependent protein